MKRAIKGIFFGSITLMGVLCTTICMGTTPTTLWSFAAGDDGAVPAAGLILGIDGNLYGTTYAGGFDGDGIIFRITPDGVLTNLYSFFRFDGAAPTSALVQGSDSNFYGVTSIFGPLGGGNLFRISPSGDLTNLYAFTGRDDGNVPVDGEGLLLAPDGNLYGTTSDGAHGNLGTVFQFTPSGTLTTIGFFEGTSNGSRPNCGLIQGSDSNFYGTAFQGGPANVGGIFRVSSTGNLTNLYSFSGPDGANPTAGLVQGSDGNFYGTTVGGVAGNNGTVFRITPGGVLTNLYVFGGFPTDGANPYAALVQGGDSNFYGTTFSGGDFGNGTLFRISPSGNLTNLYSFGSYPTDGINPHGKLLIGPDGTFYGTTENGGDYTLGTIFKFEICAPSINTTSVLLTQVGTAATVNVSAQLPNCPWTAISNDGFITITSAGSSSGNGVVSYTVATNTVSTPRLGTMTIAGQTFTVVQYGVGCGYLLVATNANISADGGANVVSVITPAGCDWTATSDSSFLTIISGSNGTGNGTVGYQFDANTNTLDRPGTMTIAGLTCTVTQAAGPCLFTLSPASATNFSWSGDSSNVTVTVNGTNCAWSAFSFSDFITITSGSNGIGNGTVTYTVATNTTTAAQCGSISIADQTFSVMQNSGDSVGDRIPNVWRAAYFGGDGTTTNSLSCATCDANGTGQNNLFKYVAVLDPTNTASVFFLRISPIPGNPNRMHLSFGPAFRDHGYLVQIAFDPHGSWGQLTATGPDIDGGTVEYDALDFGFPNVFYRINIVDRNVPQ